jgi:hypothetical protein
MPENLSSKSRFPHSDLDLDFFARKFEIKVHKHCKTVYCAYTYHYFLLFHLEEQHQLNVLFQKYEHLFDGTLG